MRSQSPRSKNRSHPSLRLALVFPTLALGLLLLTAPLPAAAPLLVPEIIVEVIDDARDRPAAGVDVVIAVRSKRGDFQTVASTTTGRDGRARFAPWNGEGLRELALSFAWQDGDLPRREMRFEMRTKKGDKTADGRRMRPGGTDSRYRMNEGFGGDCDNLFEMGSVGDALAIRFRLPETYAACEETGFKFPDYSAIGQRDINAKARNFYSFDNDVELGRNFVNGMDDEQPVLEDRMVQNYAQNLVDRLGRASDMPNLDYHVQVIDADILNAFALPGGYVFVYRGLIEATENESELVGVLAHEIAHVTGRHGTEGMTSAMFKMGTAMLLGGVAAESLTDDRTIQELILGAAMTGTNLWVVGGTRKREAEADRLGAQYAWRAGYDPQGLGTFFQKLAAGRGKKAGRIDVLFSDHPSDEERTRAVEEMTNYFLPAKEGLIVSSPEYTAVKKRLAQLPPAQVGGQPAADKIFNAFGQMNSSLMWDQFLRYVEGGGLDGGSE